MTIPWVRQTFNYLHTATIRIVIVYAARKSNCRALAAFFFGITNTRFCTVLEVRRDDPFIHEREKKPLPAT
jgi:hypothetical protein